MLDKEHRVILVDRSPVYSFAPAYTWVMLGMRDARRISRDLRSVEKKGIEFLLGEVQELDPANKHVSAGGRRLLRLSYRRFGRGLFLGRNSWPRTVLDVLSPGRCRRVVRAHSDLRFGPGGHGGKCIAGEVPNRTVRRRPAA